MRKEPKQSIGRKDVDGNEIYLNDPFEFEFEIQQLPLGITSSRNMTLRGQGKVIQCDGSLRVVDALHGEIINGIPFKESDKGFDLSLLPPSAKVRLLQSLN